MSLKVSGKPKNLGSFYYKNEMDPFHFGIISLFVCFIFLVGINYSHRENSVLFNLIWLAASEFFDMFTRSVKFYYTFYYHLLKVQMFEKCDSLNRQ